ncbi:hypothetical protein QFZ27_001615 [Inquilinus ginsengisoli]|uniref:hypothetical protein n=1 Tax=Inquilinus ginsengisoli TaxID=363840 RepID=UPI003D1AA6BF
MTESGPSAVASDECHGFIVDALDGAHLTTEGIVTHRAETPIGGSVDLGAAGA